MKIAVIGSGISGMAAAYLLCEDHDVVVFEANDYIGGHTHTVDVEENGQACPVDTGFIVFNETTYPHFLKLMKRLGVPWQPSRMSFSVTCEKTGLEYSPSSLNGLFAQRTNLLRPGFYRMILEIFRFRLQSRALLEDENYDTGIGSYLESKGYSKRFIQHFIIPMGAAIWSSDPEQFHQFPARYFVEFFRNHGFLNVFKQPQWLTITGGSRRYVSRLTKNYADRIRLNCPVQSVTRLRKHVQVTPRDGEAEIFDRVIMAAHSDQSLVMLADPSRQEVEILSAIPYQENLAILHRDVSLLPSRKTCWSSWNYRIPREPMGRIALTYDMNILQSLPMREEVCVTLNVPHKVDPGKIIRQMIYHHPLYAPDGMRARQRLNEINGVNKTFFCGAYWGYGFHEDGVNSALEVCKHFGKTL
ncbi:NAD(P)/FAD-dependent oxidoreductase [Thermodesulfobacteriota bacterium]